MSSTSDRRERGSSSIEYRADRKNPYRAKYPVEVYIDEKGRRQTRYKMIGSFETRKEAEIALYEYGHSPYDMTYKIQNNWYEVKATVKNNGTVGTDEVVQVYIKNPKSDYAVRNHSLCGMKRVFVGAGEEKEVAIRISGNAFFVYNHNGEKIIDSDLYKLYVGISQPDEVSVALTGETPIEITVQI